MDPFDLVGAKLIRGFRTKTALVVVCFLFLGVGYLARPGERPSQVPQESAVPIIAEEVRRREPALVFQTVLEAGRTARVSVAVLTTDPWSPPPVPSVASDREANGVVPTIVGLGVIHSDGRHVLSHRAALPPGPGVAALLAEGRRVPLAIEAYEMDTGLVWLAGEELAEPALVRPPEPGELAVAVTSMEDGGAFVPVLFGTECNGDCRLAMALETLPAGTPIFELGGHAIAITGEATEGMAYGIEDAVRRLRAAVREGRGLPGSLGISLQSMTPALQERLGPGVLVSDIVTDGPAAQAGIVPGDVLVQCDGASLADLDSAINTIHALIPGRAVRLRIRHAEEEREIQVVPVPISPQGPAPDPEPAGRAGGARLADVLPSAQLQALRLTESDVRVLSVNGTEVRSRDHARRLLRRAQAPSLLRIDDGQQAYFVLTAEAPR